MTNDDQPLSLALQVFAPSGAGDEEALVRTGYLKNEIEELSVDEAKLVRTAAPAGAKAGEAILIGTMAVTMLPAILTPLLELVRDWLSRNRDIRIKARIGDDEIEIEYPSALAPQIDVQHWLEAVLAKRDAASVQVQSGGATIDAEKVDVGGDVTGRDKIESAGGHIIHAESGSTVIINEHPTVQPAEYPPGNEAKQIRVATDKTENEHFAPLNAEGELTTHKNIEQEWLTRVKDGFEPIRFETPASDHPFGYPLAPINRVLLGKERIPFLLIEHPSGQGHRVIEVKPRHARDQVAKDIKPAEVRNVTSLYVLLSAGDTSRTRDGIRFGSKEIGRLVIQFHGESEPQIIPLWLGINIREWVSGETRLGFDVVAQAAAAEEVWQSLDHRHTLDMIKVDIEDGPKDVLNLFVVGECNWLTGDFKGTLPSVRISGVTYRLAEPRLPR